jgi:hypothetical protein
MIGSTTLEPEYQRPADNGVKARRSLWMKNISRSCKSRLEGRIYLFPRIGTRDPNTRIAVLFFLGGWFPLDPISTLILLHDPPT